MLELSLLAVFAHPDDETFRPGGTLALLARFGVNVQVISATRGENGPLGNPIFCSRQSLPEVREHELCCACESLGLKPPLLLEYADGQLAEAPKDEVVNQILAVIELLQPQVMVSFGKDGISGHPDHIAIGRFSYEAYLRSGMIAAFYSPAVPYSQAREAGMLGLKYVPDKTIDLSVDISPVWAKKWAAMQCHATQWSASPLKNAKEPRLRSFFGIEHFIRVAVREDANDFLWVLLCDQKTRNQGKVDA